MADARPYLPRLRQMNGHWCAFGNHARTDPALWASAMNWCKRMNEQRRAAGGKGQA